MKSYEIISTDPFIYWPDPVQTLILPYVGEFASLILHAHEVSTLLRIWLVGCRPEIDTMGEDWVRYVAELMPDCGHVQYRDVEDFVRVYIHRQVRSGLYVLDGRDVPFNRDGFVQVAVDFRWISRAN